ncbi:606_t:CDS:2 [Funneliformis caledonium]|uniref:606_t:CDS:1 n=1 Tax=Funneliformis caledonium TaxID=1117310 RepID=A0A9N9A2Z5_9GLOM|nr:606_t:CDS:2 [Funneliformis caledonium]
MTDFGGNSYGNHATNTTAKTNYRILLFGRAPGVIHTLKHSWVAVGIPLLSDKNVIDFRIFRTRANSNKQLFLLIDEFQLIFKDRNEDKLLKQLMYALGHHMTGIIPNILLSAAQDAIRAMEPIMREFTNVKEFFESLSKKNPSRIYTQISIKLDNAYKISAYANDHKMLICELIYRNIMEIKSNISNDLQDGDSTIKFEHLKRDKHLILRKLETVRGRRNFN